MSHAMEQIIASAYALTAPEHLLQNFANKPVKRMISLMSAWAILSLGCAASLKEQTEKWNYQNDIKTTTL